jgi:hypothetical protein
MQSLHNYRDIPHVVRSSALDSAQAAAIMGVACHGPDAVADHLEVEISAEERDALAPVPFSAETLRACRETHLLVACVQTSIMELHTRFNEEFLQREDPWFAHGQRFAESRIATGWRLVRRDPVPGSSWQPRERQLTLMGTDERVPDICEVVYTMILHRRRTGERLLDKRYVRTDSLCEAGTRALAGCFGEQGIFIFGFRDRRVFRFVELAATRRLA